MTDAISAQGTIFSISPDPTWPPSSPVGGAVTFTDVAELGDLDPPELNRNEIETTVHNSLDERYIMGIRRKGEMGININYIPTDTTHNSVAGLQKKIQDGTRHIMKVTYPDTSYFMFSGFIKSFKPTAPVDDKLSADVTIRPTGSHLWGPSA